MKLLSLDVETTGTDPHKHAILQMAGIIDIDGKHVDHFNIFCRPDVDQEINPEALAVNGITERQFSGYPTQQDAYKQLVHKLSAHVKPWDRNDKFILSGKGVSFDYRFLFEFFNRQNKNTQDRRKLYFGHFVRTRPLAELEALTVAFQQAGYMPDLPDHKLTTLTKAFQIDHARAHDAGSDIKATRQINKFYVSVIRKGLEASGLV